MTDNKKCLICGKPAQYEIEVRKEDSKGGKIEKHYLCKIHYAGYQMTLKRNARFREQDL
jgi:hypothetical protein